MNLLEKSRENINEIDKQMAALFEKRMKEAANVLAYKKENGLPVFDKKREEEVIKNNIKLLEDVNLAPYYEEYLRCLMDISKKYQNSIL